MSGTRTIAGALAAAVILATAATPAAGGFFERLFGGFTRHVQPPPVEPPRMSPNPGERIAPQGRDDWRPRSGSGGPRMAYCVRTCDGFYFPVHPHAGFSAAQMCSTFCPASETRLYAGSGIDHATGRDGQPYSALPQAYAYRKQLVAGCTCNGHDVFGVARIAIRNDPTLQRGDVVATEVHGRRATPSRSSSVE
jgi:hypothetical protein